MGLLKIVFVIFLLLFPVAEIGRIQFSNGVAVSLNDILLSVVILSWLLYKFSKKKKEIKGELKVPLIIFISVALFSLLFNISNLNFGEFLISFSYLIRFVSYALIYFIIKDFDIKFIKKLPLFLLFSGSMVVLGGYVQYFLYPNLRNLYYLGWDEHLYRMFSSFLDPNFVGAFFVIFLMFALSLLRKFIEEKSRLKSLLLLLISVFTLVSIYLTYSRSALIMLIVSVITFLILIGQKKLILISVLGLILLIFLAPRSFRTEGTNFLRTASSEARLTSVQIAVNIFATDPIFGVGFDAYRYAQNRYAGLNNEYWQITHSGAGTDDSLIFVLATTGIVGFLAFIWLLYKIFGLAKNNLGKNFYALALFSSLVGLLLDSIFINSLFYVLILEWIWILASLTENS